MMNNLKKGANLAKGPQKRKGFDEYGNVICEGCFTKKLEIDELKEENRKLRQRQYDFDKLKQELREAKKELRMHQDKLKRQDPSGVPSEGSHLPSSARRFKSKSSAENVAKRGGALQGHQGHGRAKVSKAQAEQVILVVAPDLCPDCQRTLQAKECRERTVLEVEHVPVKKTVYQFERKKCPGCGSVYQGQASLAPRALYGNGLLAKMLVMHFIHGITIGKLSKILGDDIKPSGVIAAFHRVAARFELALQTLQSIYKESKVKHADETGWRVDGQTGWAWLFCTQRVSIFEHALSRAQKIVHNILGNTRLPGVLVVDRYGGYNRAPCRIQYCYAHLLRDVKKLSKEFPENTEVLEFVDGLASLLCLAMKLPSRAMSHKEYCSEARDIKRQILSLIARPSTHFGIGDIQNIFRKGNQRLYHWTTSRNIPAHNNFAEREIRQTVIARKVSLGSQSEKGARSRSILSSVLHTAQKNVGSQEIELWTAHALNSVLKNQCTNVASCIPFPKNLIPHIY